MGQYKTNTDGIIVDSEGHSVMMEPKGLTHAPKVLNYLVQFCMYETELAKLENPELVMESGEAEESAIPTDAFCPFDQVGKELAKLSYSGTVLDRFLKRSRAISAAQDVEDNDPVIFPFGCNRSQHRAVLNALQNQVSVIEGPPGTGKTQTILNLIANLIIRGKSVAVVSNNNSAVQNVIDKMKKYGLDWLIASLGSKANVQSFFANGTPQVSLKEEWLQTKEAREELREDVEYLDEKVSKIFENAIKRESLSLRLRDTEHEREVFIAQHSMDMQSMAKAAALFNGWSSAKLNKVEASFVKYTGTDKFKSLWAKLLLRVRVREKFDSMVEMRDFVLLAIALAKYDAIIRKLKEEIESLREAKNAKVLVDDYVSFSSKLLYDSVFRTYQNKSFREFTAQNYKSQSTFTKRFPIVTSSTYSLARCTEKPFDYVIVDEASQVNLPTGALCMGLAKNMVIVGDRRQLPHIADERSLHPCAGVEDAYDAVNESLLSSVMGVFGKTIPNTLLVEHYRCHPLIIGYCNKRFYDGQMVVMTHSTVKFPFRIVDVPTGALSRDYLNRPINIRQLEETKTIVTRCRQKRIPDSEIGIVSPYRGHANVVSNALETIEADTVHRFQGREKDVIIYNTVQNRVTCFNDDPHLINVAVSRAKSEFVLVAPKEAVLTNRDSNLAALILFIDYHDPDSLYTRRSKYCSVFDQLFFEGYEFGGHQGESPAETLFRRMLKSVLSRRQGLAFIQEYYLINLARGKGEFTAEEWRFMANGSRLDFLIYDSMGNEPVLVVEVDGSQHDTPEQHRRDALKDSVLTKLGIPHARFRTDSRGGERARLEALLG